MAPCCYNCTAVQSLSEKYSAYSQADEKDKEALEEELRLAYYSSHRIVGTDGLEVTDTDFRKFLTSLSEHSCSICEPTKIEMALLRSRIEALEAKMQVLTTSDRELLLSAKLVGDLTEIYDTYLRQFVGEYVYLGVMDRVCEYVTVLESHIPNKDHRQEILRLAAALTQTSFKDKANRDKNRTAVLRKFKWYLEKARQQSKASIPEDGNQDPVCDGYGSEDADNCIDPITEHSEALDALHRVDRDGTKKQLGISGSGFEQATLFKQELAKEGFKVSELSDIKERMTNTRGRTAHWNTISASLYADEITVEDAYRRIEKVVVKVFDPLEREKKVSAESPILTSSYLIGLQILLRFTRHFCDDVEHPFKFRSLKAIESST